MKTLVAGDFWYTWMYLHRARVVHALGPDRRLALCGIEPNLLCPFGWLGTGTQEEYERAEELPRCKRCLGRMRAFA